MLDRVRPHELARLGIARTLQGVGLFAGLTALENVMVGAERQARAGLASALLGLPRSDRAERRLRALALAALDDLGVGRRRRTGCPGSLPYGVQKRVALARALVAHPRLLLLDEPAGGLDEDDMAELGELIRALTAGPSVLLVEHHMDLVMAVCDRVVVLDFGAGSPRAPRPRSRSTRACSTPTSGSRSMLRIESLRTAYGAVVALDDVSFDVAEGSITAVLGANGAGKTSCCARSPGSCGRGRDESCSMGATSHASRPRTSPGSGSRTSPRAAA